MDNIKIYELARVVPQEAKKEIKAGRLKGMTDINPMYRIKRLTEIFGPCGVGWWYDITDKQIVFDEITGQKCAFVDVLLYYVDPDTGATSNGIPGTGGASFVATERNGPYMSDECYKMALTDALSVSAKALGIGADVYWGADRSKYTDQTQEKPQAKPAPKAWVCFDCGKELTAEEWPNGKTYSAEQVATASYKKFGAVLCGKCATARGIEDGSQSDAT